MITTLHRTLLAAFAGAALAFASPALAEAPAGGDAHGDDGHATHGYDYAGDDDGDGIPNWRDYENGPEINEHYVANDLGWHLFNLLLLIGAIFYFARRPVGDALKNRARDTQADLTEAARLREEAQRRNEEIGARLAGFEQEVAAMRAEAKKAAAAEEAALIERARAEAQRIAETSQRNINEELVKAQVALRKDAVNLAVQLAEQTLKNRVQSDDQRRLARQFLDTINADGA